MSEVIPGFEGFISPSTQALLWWISHHGINGHPPRTQSARSFQAGAPVPVPWLSNPPPEPWHARFLIAAVSSKIAAANMSDRTAAQQIIASADQAIAAFIDSDDICPPWPWPGPPPWLGIIASELVEYASSLPEGELKAQLLQIAGRILDRAQALATGSAGRTFEGSPA